jgi:putative heme transporter
VLLAVLAGIGALVGFRVVSRLRELTGPLAAGVDRIRVWLTEGPLTLDPQQVASIRNQVVGTLYDAAPSPVAGARMVLFALTALVLVVFLVFFLLADGDRMWAWLVVRVPQRRQGTVDGAGRAAWTTLGRYVRGVVVVAVIDAVGIGAALLLLGVPLWLSLTLLVFLGAFVPIVGATLTGVVAVLVTLVTEDVSDAVVVLVVVLVVQQLEGNVLQPLIMGRAVRLHPVVILLAVTAATLLFGVAGAVVAVPVVAVAYQVAEYLRTARTAAVDPAEPSPATDASPVAAAEA